MVPDNTSKPVDMAHIETIEQKGVERRRSSVTDIAHTEVPVWQIRKTYTRQGENASGRHKLS